ncbi:MAG: T9SS type A sorting domain-containing protein [Saprospiraceae bacterium]|nr:T9SS type A sorting domain-containing protein [Saprospiraceae bacterium]
MKNKIAVIDLNKDCDVTKVCLNVQRAGAKAFVIVHNSNSNGNIKLPKNGVYKDSIRIPIFTIRRSLGERITSMLPSWVGISCRRLPAQTTTRASDLTFDAEAQEERARLMWVAPTETHNQYFVVEKQNPITGAFEPLTTVLGQQGVEIGQYAIHDEKPFEGDNTYRIKMVMPDGSSQFSDTRTIRFASFNTVNIFPNPTSDILNIAIQGYENQPIDISIFDIQGKSIHQQHIDAAPATTLVIPLSQKAASGQYVLRIRSAGKKDVIQRFTVSL